MTQSFKCVTKQLLMVSSWAIKSFCVPFCTSRQKVSRLSWILKSRFKMLSVRDVREFRSKGGKIKKLQGISLFFFLAIIKKWKNAICSKMDGPQFSSIQSLSRVWFFATACSMLGLPVHHQLLEFKQTHVHWVSDAIQPSHPLSCPSPPAFNLSQHQGLFKWVSSLHQGPKLEFQLQHQSFPWTLRTDFL